MTRACAATNARGTNMLKMVPVLLVALTLAACDAVSTMTEGFQHMRAVETDLEKSIGSKPQVGFNWHSGRLTSVNVTFSGLQEGKPLRELTETVLASVTQNFKQKPEQIVVAFVLRGEP
jgi:hypothetical protein